MDRIDRTVGATSVVCNERSSRARDRRMKTLSDTKILGMEMGGPRDGGRVGTGQIEGVTAPRACDGGSLERCRSSVYSRLASDSTDPSHSHIPSSARHDDDAPV
eukprot:3798860-Prymnesium_polylepis.1